MNNEVVEQASNRAFDAALDWVPKAIILVLLCITVNFLIKLIIKWTNRMHEEVKQNLLMLTASLDTMSKNVNELRDSFLKLNFQVSSMITSENHSKVISQIREEFGKEIIGLRERLLMIERR